MPSQQNGKTNSLVAKQLCSLREHATLKSFGVYSTSNETTPPVRRQKKGRANKSHDGASTGDRSQPLRPRSQRILSEPSVLETIDELSHPKPHPLGSVSAASEPALSTLPDRHPVPGGGASATMATLDARYFGVAEASAQKLVEAADGQEREGWVMVGTTKDVKVMKKPAGKDEPPVNSVKGVGRVNAPPQFIVRVLHDPKYTTVLDDMLKESRVKQELSKSLHLVHLLYKAVWPTAPREFTVLSILGQLDDRTWISSGVSVDDPRMPPEKGYVRGQLEVGGYLIRSVPSNPEVSEVTYVARVNLKGNIPAFAVNKISESQPLCVNRLRVLMEPLYVKMKSDPQKMREFEEKYPIAMVVPPKPHPSTSTEPTPLPAMEGVEPTGDVTPEDEGLEVVEEGDNDTKATSEDSEARVLPGEGHSGEGGGVSPPINGGGVAAGGNGPGGERAETGEHVIDDNSEREERGGGDKEGSVLVISMSDLKPTEALRVPHNNKLVPPASDSLFSVGEEDKESLADSWNGEFLETFTPEQLPSDPEEEGEKGAEAGEAEGYSNRANSNSVFVRKPGPALQLKLPNYQRVRESVAASDEALEVRIAVLIADCLD